jgi:opacity protein-like surface antigen
MKRIIPSGFVISALLITAPLSTAYAADMPVKAPLAPVAPTADWSGFYGDVGLGGERSSTTWFYNGGGLPGFFRSP